VALEHAILVSLTEQAGSGYELARRFDKSIGYFWTATHQQIYKVLGRMESSGWVSVTVVPQDNRPDKKVYDVTDAGRTELRRWIAEPSEDEVARSDFAVKLRGASSGDIGVVVDEVRRRRARHAERLDAYLANEKHEFPDPTRLQGRTLHQYLVLRGGIMLEQGLLDWCDEILAALAPTTTTTKNTNTVSDQRKNS
jgi:DNA-binding PadR family transcriptional regulator